MDNLLLSRYRLIRLLGGGTRGATFAAEDLGRSRIVVVKALVPSAFPADQAALLDASFAAVRAVAHPNLAAWLDLVHIEEPPPGHTGWPPTSRDVAVREWVEGQSLVESLPSLDMSARVEVCFQVCRALGALHRAGLAHGALHPANVLVVSSPAGPRVAVVDHGLDARAAVLVSGERFSSYVAPERVGGQPDLRADLFSLGVLLREVFGLDTGLAVASASDPFFAAVRGLVEWLTARDPALRPAGPWEVGEAVAKAAKRIFRLAPEESGRGAFLQAGWVPREREMLPLRARWREATGSGEAPRPRPGVVVVTGPVGCGKSCILDRFASEVRASGAVVARGAARPDGMDGFEPAVDVLNALDVTRQLSASPVPEDLVPYRPALLRLLGLTGPSTEELHGRDADREDLGVQEAFTQVILLAAKARPVLVVVDDLQWADEGTVRLLGHLTRTLATGVDRPVLLVLGTRPELPEAINETFLKPLGPPVGVASWTHEEASAWLEGFLGVRSLPEGIDALLARAVGNPLLLEESTKDLLETGALALVDGGFRLDSSGGPADLAELYKRRLDRVGAEEASLLLDLAAYGRPATVAEVVGLTGGGQKVLTALLGLVARQLVRREERGGVLTFRLASWELARAVRLRADLNARLVSHRRAAKLLEGRGKLALESRAWQAMQGHLGSESLLLVLEAEDLARRRHSWTRAITLCEKALDLLPRDDRTRRARVLKEMGDVQVEAGLADRALDAYQKARDLAFDVMGMPERAELVRATVRALASRGMAREAVTQGTQAVESLVLDGCAEERARLCEAVASAALLLLESERCVEVALRGLASTRGVTERTRARLECIVSAGLRMKGDAAKAGDAARRAIGFAQAAGDARGEAHAQGHLAASSNDAGELEAAREVYERQLVMWRRLNDPEGVASALANLGGVALRQGKVREALSYVEGSLVARERIGRGAGIAQALLAAGRIHFLTGRLADARVAWTRAEALRAEIGDKRGRLTVSTLLAWLAERTGEWGEAVTRHRQALDERQILGDRPGACASMIGLASVLLAIGDRRGSADANDQALALAMELHHPEFHARVQLLRGAMARRSGDREGAGRLLMQAQAEERDLHNLEGELEAAIEGMELSIDAGDSKTALRTLAWCRLAASNLGAGWHLLRAGLVEARMELAGGQADPARVATMLSELHERAAGALPLRAEAEEKMAEALRAAGQADAAARWAENAAGTWREIASTLSAELQAAFWADPRRRGMKQKAVAAGLRERAGAPAASLADDSRAEWTLAFLEERLAGHLGRRAIDEALGALGASRGLLWIAATGESIARRVMDDTGFEDWAAGDFPRAMACEAAGNDAPWITDDVTRDAAMEGKPDDDRPRGSFCALPMPGKEGPIGGLYLDAPTTGVFGRIGRATLETFARAVSLAWERLERERESRERAIVAALLKKTFARPEAEEVVRKVVTLAKRLSGASRSGLLVREGEGFRPLLVRPEGTLDEGALAESVSATGAAVYGREAGPGSVMCVPLVSGEKSIGVIYLESESEPFPPRVVARVTAFADLLAGPLAMALRGAPAAVAPAKRAPEPAVAEAFIAQSRGIRDALAMIERVADDGMAVLFVGEEGTGKEALARALHERSPRRGQPFLVESCGALSEGLLEAALFGQRKGAFPGADRDKRGAIDRAKGGTIYLDGVERIPPLTLDKLVQAYAARRVLPIGGIESVPFEARLVVGSARALPELAERLGGVTVTVPPLRERREEIPMHAERVLAAVSRETKAAKKRLDKRVLEAFLCYEWPGNLREMEGELRRMAMLAKKVIGPDLLSPAILGSTVQQGGPAKGTFAASAKEMEREAIRRAVSQAEGSIRAAAKALGMDRMTLTRRMRKYGIVIPESQADDREEAGGK